MRFQIFIITAILSLTLILTGCPGNSPANNGNTAANTTAKTETNNNSNSTFGTTVKTPEPANNEAPTLKPTFLAYCEAKTKGDEAALRKVYSQATLKQFEADMKAENEKSLVKYLEVDQVSNKLCQIRNEKIEGDRASAIIVTEGMPNGNVRAVFVKENGEWKMTNETEDFKNVSDAVKNAPANSNTAK